MRNFPHFYSMANLRLPSELRVEAHKIVFDGLISIYLASTKNMVCRLYKIYAIIIEIVELIKIIFWKV